MIKVMISQPMKGLTQDEILDKRKEYFKTAQKQLAKELDIDKRNIVLLDTFLRSNVPADVTPLWYFSFGLYTYMTQADYIVFAPGYENARGCKLEYDVAFAYDKRIIKL